MCVPYTNNPQMVCCCFQFLNVFACTQPIFSFCLKNYYCYLSIYSKALLTDESIISTTLLQCGRSHWDNIICNLEQKSALISIGNSWELFGFELFKLFSYEFKNVCSKFCNMILGLFCYYEWDLNYISKF